jgi:hypothetical protein
MVHAYKAAAVIPPAMVLDWVAETLDLFCCGSLLLPFLNGWRRENVRKKERIGEKEERKESQEDIK